MSWQLPIGAQVEGDGVRFRVWAPDCARVDVVLLDEQHQEIGAYPLERDDEGYFAAHVAGISAGSRYVYNLDGDVLRPDPASRYQPEDVHGASQVVAADFPWTDSIWRGVSLHDAVIYETHIGTATPEGTFKSLIARLPQIRELGITAIEIMPVADFPGDRNWGYDGVLLYAPARAYGGAEGFKALVDAAHNNDLAVILDVVYNHFGPAGNYLRDFSKHYFTHDKHTPWGDAIDFAERPVREFFINNALYWAHEYHIDGFRLDATHAILDDSKPHVLAEMTTRVRASLSPDRHILFFAEDERNEVRLLQPAAEDGWGMNALWADDFHHEVRSAIAGDNEGYFAYYSGLAAELVETINRNWFYRGRVENESGHDRGTDASSYDPEHFVYCIQNHDQIGNRAVGDRITATSTIDSYRAASALLLLAPATPLLFQGQEWAASTPFLFFTDHDAELGKLITEGRRKEFSYFAAFAHTEVPDPQAESTFQASKLRWEEIEQEPHSQILALYKDALALRHAQPAFRASSRDDWQAVLLDNYALALRYHGTEGADLLLLVNLKDGADADLTGQDLVVAPEGARWQVALASEAPSYGGAADPAALQAQIDSGRFAVGAAMTLALVAVPE